MSFLLIESNFRVVGHPSLMFWQESDRQFFGVWVSESHVCGGMSCDLTLGEGQEADWLICTKTQIFSSPACLPVKILMERPALVRGEYEICEGVICVEDWTLEDSQKPGWLRYLCSPVWSSERNLINTPMEMELFPGRGVSGVIDLMLEDSLISELLRCLSTGHPSLIFWQL